MISYSNITFIYRDFIYAQIQNAHIGYQDQALKINDTPPKSSDLRSDFYCWKGFNYFKS